jgi:hypothetical protein
MKLRLATKILNSKGVADSRGLRINRRASTGFAAMRRYRKSATAKYLWRIARLAMQEREAAQ